MMSQLWKTTTHHWKKGIKIVVSRICLLLNKHWKWYPNAWLDRPYSFTSSDTKKQSVWCFSTKAVKYPKLQHSKSSGGSRNFFAQLRMHFFLQNLQPDRLSGEMADLLFGARQFYAVPFAYLTSTVMIHLRTCLECGESGRPNGLPDSSGGHNWRRGTIGDILTHHQHGIPTFQPRY